MTITELKEKLERAAAMGYGTAEVTVVEPTPALFGFTYVTRALKGLHLIHLGTNLLDEPADPSRDDYELRLDLDRDE